MAGQPGCFGTRKSTGITALGWHHEHMPAMHGARVRGNRPRGFGVGTAHIPISKPGMGWGGRVVRESSPMFTGATNPSSCRCSAWATVCGGVRWRNRWIGGGAQCGAVRCGAVRCGAVPCGASLLCSAAPVHCSVLHGTGRHCAVLDCWAALRCAAPHRASKLTHAHSTPHTLSSLSLDALEFYATLFLPLQARSTIL